MMSAWPAWRACSSIRCMSTQRRLRPIGERPSRSVTPADLAVLGDRALEQRPDRLDRVTGFDLHLAVVRRRPQTFDIAPCDLELKPTSLHVRGVLDQRQQAERTHSRMALRLLVGEAVELVQQRPALRFEEHHEPAPARRADLRRQPACRISLGATGAAVGTPRPVRRSRPGCICPRPRIRNRPPHTGPAVLAGRHQYARGARFR